MSYFDNPDRIWRNNDSDGSVFYGYDDKDTGMTDWYDSNGYLDSRTTTPSDDEQEQNNAGY